MKMKLVVLPVLVALAGFLVGCPDTPPPPPPPVPFQQSFAVGGFTLAENGVKTNVQTFSTDAIVAARGVSFNYRSADPAVKWVEVLGAKAQFSIDIEGLESTTTVDLQTGVIVVDTTDKDGKKKVGSLAVMSVVSEEGEKGWKIFTPLQEPVIIWDNSLAFAIEAYFASGAKSSDPVIVFALVAAGVAIDVFHRLNPEQSFPWVFSDTTEPDRVIGVFCPMSPIYKLAQVTVDLKNSQGTTGQDTRTIIPGPASSIDSDHDTLPNAWESSHSLDPNSPIGEMGALGDPDKDGLSNILELGYGTDPYGPNGYDSDGDHWSDGEEHNGGTDPLDPDDHPSVRPIVISGITALDDDRDGRLEVGEMIDFRVVLSSSGSGVLDIKFFIGGTPIENRGVNLLDFVFATPGTKQVSVTVSDHRGQEVTFVQPFVVYTNGVVINPPSLRITSPLPSGPGNPVFYPGMTMVMTATASGDFPPDVQYSWFTPWGVTVLGLNTSTVIPNLIGSNYLFVRAEKPDGTLITSASVWIQVDPIITKSVTLYASELEAKAALAAR